MAGNIAAPIMVGYPCGDTICLTIDTIIGIAADCVVLVLIFFRAALVAD